MKLMKRLRDGKVAVYDQGCVESGTWVPFEEQSAKDPLSSYAFKRKPRKNKEQTTDASESVVVDKFLEVQESVDEVNE